MGDADQGDGKNTGTEGKRITLALVVIMALLVLGWWGRKSMSKSK